MKKTILSIFAVLSLAVLASCENKNANAKAEAETNANDTTVAEADTLYEVTDSVVDVYVGENLVDEVSVDSVDVE